MIHRQNYTDVRAYLRYIENVRQNEPNTVKRARTHLRHLLEWADEIPFPKSRSIIDPTFPAYLSTIAARSDGKEKLLAPASITKCLANARQFYTYARAEWPHRYKAIPLSWIGLLQPARHARMESRLPARELYTLDDVLQIAGVATETLRLRRGQVAVCMLYLSGMRADALASMPIHCIDLDQREIRQLPEDGVRTKNRKAAVTYLLDIPELLAVCQSWDQMVRSALPADALWYSNLTTDGMALLPATHAVLGRTCTVEHDVRLICQAAAVPYRSPHKLRHGHVVYALKRAHNMAELKAISQNVMHASVTITDQIYGRLVNDDVRAIITGLGQSPAEPTLEQKLDRLLAILDKATQ